MNKLILFASAVMICLFGACSSDNDPDQNQKQEDIRYKPRVDIPLSSRQKEIMSSKKTFDINFFRNAYAKADSESRKRFIVSPYSASVCLAMLAEGADDNVRTDMMKAFLGKEASVEELSEMMQLMSESLADVDNTVKFKESNSVWYDKKVTLGSDFSKALSRYFNAPSSQCDMYSAQASKQINAWVKDATNGLIDKIFNDEEIPATDALLTNAIYFRGLWTEPFDMNKTSKASFNNASGNKVTVDMMSGTLSRCGGLDECGKVVHLSYGNQAYNMTVILPDGPVDEFVANLTAESWMKLRSLYSDRGVYVKLPRFTVSSEDLIINNVLKSIGFESNFAEGTSYDRICTGLKGSSLKVKHSTVLKVDESGSEGAAVTSTGLLTSPGEPSNEPIYFTADRPFIFIIDESSTGTILFAGVINEM